MKSMTLEELPKSFEGLCQFAPPRPIHSQGRLKEVVAISDAMAGHALTTDQQDYFDLLCCLIEDWEQGRAPKPRATARETLQSLLETHGMSSSDLARLLKIHRTHGAMILRGERRLTLKHVKTLANYFSVSTDAFVD